MQEQEAWRKKRQIDALILSYLNESGKAINFFDAQLEIIPDPEIKTKLEREARHKLVCVRVFFVLKQGVDLLVKLFPCLDKTDEYFRSLLIDRVILLHSFLVKQEEKPLKKSAAWLQALRSVYGNHYAKNNKEQQ